MKAPIAPALLLLLHQAGAGDGSRIPTPGPGTHDLVLQAAGVGQILYGLSVPNGYNAVDPRPLVVALHPGGERMRYYGSAYMKLVVMPGVRDLQPIIVAPDCPTQGWTDEAAERAVMALVQHAFEHYAIDRSRVLVTGFSLGGRGTWFMASHHPDVFTAAIPMAAATGNEPIERLATMPTYVIHSRDDQVVPFGPAEKNFRDLQRMGRTIRSDWLFDISHHEMVGYVDSLRRGARWIANEWRRAPRR
jgi:predicted peptidase